MAPTGVLEEFLGGGGAVLARVAFVAGGWGRGGKGGSTGGGAGGELNETDELLTPASTQLTHLSTDRHLGQRPRRTESSPA